MRESLTRKNDKGRLRGPCGCVAVAMRAYLTRMPGFAPLCGSRM
ncbi:hypothetical protein Y048_3681 [Burkholderia pseudomallei MSHR456]|nr:hypothetical protein Y048_3681 [Burkholderia pseudomallei MSHR456]